MGGSNILDSSFSFHFCFAALKFHRTLKLILLAISGICIIYSDKVSLVKYARIRDIGYLDVSKTSRKIHGSPTLDI